MKARRGSFSLRFNQVKREVEPNSLSPFDKVDISLLTGRGRDDTIRLKIESLEQRRGIHQYLSQQARQPGREKGNAAEAKGKCLIPLPLGRRRISAGLSQSFVERCHGQSEPRLRGPKPKFPVDRLAKRFIFCSKPRAPGCGT